MVSSHRHRTHSVRAYIDHIWENEVKFNCQINIKKCSRQKIELKKNRRDETDCKFLQGFRYIDEYNTWLKPKVIRKIY